MPVVLSSVELLIVAQPTVKTVITHTLWHKLTGRGTVAQPDWQGEAHAREVFVTTYTSHNENQRTLVYFLKASQNRITE